MAVFNLCCSNTCVCIDINTQNSESSKTPCQKSWATVTKWDLMWSADRIFLHGFWFFPLNLEAKSSHLYVSWIADAQYTCVSTRPAFDPIGCALSRGRCRAFIYFDVSNNYDELLKNNDICEWDVSAAELL